VTHHRAALALVASGAAFGLAVQTHITALTIGPGVLGVLPMPSLVAAVRGGAVPAWPRPGVLLLVAGAGLLMILILILYNLMIGPASITGAEHRVRRYVGEASWTLDAWGDRLLALLQAAALAVGGRTSELETPATALLSPFVILAVALALLGLWVAVGRASWLPLLVTLSVLLSVSLLNGRVEPIVPRVRHYATLVPLGAVMIAVGLVWLHQRAAAWRPAPMIARAVAQFAVLLVAVALVGGSTVSYEAYEEERLSRPDKNNGAFLAVVDAVAESGERTERLHLDDALGGLPTLSGGRMLAHLRYAFEVAGHEVDTIELDEDRLSIGPRGAESRRLVLRAETVPPAAARYRLVPLPGEPGEGAPLRAFRAFPLRQERAHTISTRRRRGRSAASRPPAGAGCPGYRPGTASPRRCHPPTRSSRPGAASGERSPRRPVRWHGRARSARGRSPLRPPASAS
jgi:hypothetical protein